MKVLNLLIKLTLSIVFVVQILFHSCPLIIISDRDGRTPTFFENVFESFCNMELYENIYTYIRMFIRLFKSYVSLIIFLLFFDEIFFIVAHGQAEKQSLILK